MTLSWQCDLI